MPGERVEETVDEKPVAPQPSLEALFHAYDRACDVAKAAEAKLAEAEAARSDAVQAIVARHGGNGPFELPSGDTVLASRRGESWHFRTLTRAVTKVGPPTASPVPAPAPAKK